MASFNFAGALASGATPQDITSFLSSKGQGQLAQTYFNTNPSNPNTGNNPNVNPLSALKNYATSVLSSIKGSVNNAANDLATHTKSPASEVQGGFQAGGDLAAGALSPLTEAIKGIANGLAETKAVQSVANSPVGNAVAGAEKAAGNNPVTSKLSAWAQQYPDAAKDLGALGNIAALGTSIDASPTAVDLAGEGATKVGEAVSAAGDKVASALPDTTPPAPTPEDTQQVAARAIQNPLSATEQEQAAAQGRTSLVNGKPTIADSPRDIAMQKALQPLVENGQITANVDKTTKLVNGDEQLNNIDNVNTAIANQGTQISEGVGTHNKPYSPQDLNKAIFNTEVPSSIKPTDEKVANLQNAVFKIIQDNSKDTQGLLQARQQFDALVKKDYPNLYEQGMSPTKQYIGNLRETLNDFTAKQLPEGKLPNGVGFRDALKNQHQLINAREEMTQKFVREYPQGSTNFSRFTKAHPQSRYLSRFVERRGLFEALKVAGGAGAAALAIKASKK